jgi:hypothetical protein
MPRQRNLSQVLSITPNTTGSFILGCSGFQVWSERSRHYFKSILFLVIFPGVIEGLKAQSIQSARPMLLKKLGGLLVHGRFGLA